MLNYLLVSRDLGTGINENLEHGPERWMELERTSELKNVGTGSEEVLRFL